MKMKIAAIFISLVLVCAANECTEEKSAKCVERMLDLVLEEKTPEEVCEEMLSVTDCLQNTADECLGDDKDPRLEKQLTDLKKQLREQCASTTFEEVDSELENCYVENQAYILQCLGVALVEASDLLGEPENFNSDVLNCAVSKLLPKCVVDRTVEKCGEEGGKKAEEVLEGMDTTLGDSCSTPESLEFFSSQLMDLKKKK